MTTEMLSAVTTDNPAAKPEPGEPRITGRTKLVNAGLSILLLIVVLVIVEVVSRSGLVSILLVPPPSAIFTTLWGGLTSGIYWVPLLDSLGAALAGFLIAAV